MKNTTRPLRASSTACGSRNRQESAKRAEPNFRMESKGRPELRNALFGLFRWDRSYSKKRNGRTGVPSCLTASRRSEEHTSELQSLTNLVCRLLLEKKKKKTKKTQNTQTKTS